MTVSFATQFADTRTPIQQTSSAADRNCNPAPQHEVGRVLPITIRELQAHASACHLLMQLARARCRPEIHSAQDEADVQHWTVAKAEAESALLEARRAEAVADQISFDGEWTGEVDGRRQVG